MRFIYIRAKGHMGNEGKDVADLRAGLGEGLGSGGCRIYK